VRARLGAMPDEERRHWEGVLAATGADRDSIAFLALSLDAAGRPIPVVNTDPATALFLGDLRAAPEGAAAGAARAARVERDVAAIVRPYPVGLFIAGLGPVVANDAYAPPAVWTMFRDDLYHSPKVVWGREVNLLVLGLARRLGALLDESGRPRDPALAAHARALAGALRRVVAAGGLEHGELWSYAIEDGRLVPARYGTGSDVQLWSLTDLAVQYELSRLPATPAP
jgi:hypothetical protein